MSSNFKRIYLSPPHMSGNEMKYIKEAFDQNWIAPLGPNVDAFEQAIASYTGIPHVAALSSGTAAIHLALLLLGVRPEDKVLASTFTFSATINPIVYLGASPVLIDSEPNTWNMDPDLLEKAIEDSIRKGEKPKAIILVHLYGMPAQIDRIMHISQKYEIPVIEDAAEAMGSKYKGMHTGSFGKLAIYSFNGNKILNTSGGGVLVSDSRDLIEEARFLSTQAREPAAFYQHKRIGYNYRMSNILAGVGRGQMEVAEQRVMERRANFQYYREQLSEIKGMSFLEEPDTDYYSNHWLTTIQIDRKSTGPGIEEIQKAFSEENIETRHLWKPMHMQPVFEGCKAYLNGVSEKLFINGLCLPSGSSLSLTDKDRVIRILRNLLD